MPAAPKLDERYTYANLLTWPEDERWELIDGVPYAMASPGTKHQRISGNLFWKLREYLEDKKCEVFSAPYDVRLNADKDDDTVVQPDLIVVCDPEIIDDKGCKGAPDLVIEILSPSTSDKDRTKKFRKYREAEVLEIWFLDPDTGTTDAYRFKNGKYDVDFYVADDIVPVGILPGFEINMKDIF